MKTLENGTNFLESGDKFTPEMHKIYASKTYDNRFTAKILCTDGIEVMTSSARIIKVLENLQYEGQNIELEVFSNGTFNGNPILSVRSDRPEVMKEIRKILF